ncbi:hypothetical protein FKM82_022447 [Ascaphus truei]
MSGSASTCTGSQLEGITRAGAINNSPQIIRITIITFTVSNNHKPHTGNSNTNGYSYTSPRRALSHHRVSPHRVYSTRVVLWSLHPMCPQKCPPL